MTIIHSPEKEDILAELCNICTLCVSQLTSQTSFNGNVSKSQLYIREIVEIYIYNFVPKKKLIKSKSEATVGLKYGVFVCASISVSVCVSASVQACV